MNPSARPMENDHSVVLRITGVTKCFGSLCALERVDLDVLRGEIFGLLGPNGAGKTTLISIVAGLVRRSSGTVEVLGYDLDRHPMRVRAGLGLVPQELAYDPFFTVNEVLRFTMGYFGMRPDQERIDRLLATFDLTDKKHSNTRALSGGMKRRLMIAKALVHDPPLIFLDEPTAGVDVELREELWRYVNGLRERGTTIVLTTHYMEEAERLADRIGVLNQGRLVRTGTREELIHEFGEQVLLLHVDRLPARLAPRLADLGVTAVADRPCLTYRYRESDGRLTEVLDAMRAEGLRVNHIQDRHERLGDVFLKILAGDAGRPQ